VANAEGFLSLFCNMFDGHKLELRFFDALDDPMGKLLAKHTVTALWAPGMTHGLQGARLKLGPARSPVWCILPGLNA